MKMHPREQSTGSLIQPSAPGAFSYWMIPCPEALKTWQLIIDQLGEKYGGNKFEPHATVYFSPYQKGFDPKDLLLLLDPVQITMQVESLEFSDKFTKTCFIQFEQSREFTSLSEDLHRISGGEPFDLNPHMSLFYGHLNDYQREEIKRVIQPKLPVTILFNAIWAVSNQDGVIGVTDSSHIAGWQLAAETKWT